MLPLLLALLAPASAEEAPACMKEAVGLLRYDVDRLLSCGSTTWTTSLATRGRSIRQRCGPAWVGDHPCASQFTLVPV